MGGGGERRLRSLCFSSFSRPSIIGILCFISPPPIRHATLSGWNARGTRGGGKGSSFGIRSIGQADLLREKNRSASRRWPTLVADNSGRRLPGCRRPDFGRARRQDQSIELVLVFFSFSWGDCRFEIRCGAPRVARFHNPAGHVRSLSSRVYEGLPNLGVVALLGTV